MAAWLQRHWFLLGMAVVLVAARLLPSWAEQGGAGLIKSALVAAIFLASGLAIRTRELLSGLRHWRLHALIQGCSLVAAPLLCLGLDQIWIVVGLDANLRLGLFLLGALPTTITSCVALTAAAGGNQAAALINASLGNLIGVVLTPLYLIAFAQTAQAEIALLPVFQKLGLLVLLPLVIGQLLRLSLAHAFPPGFLKSLGKISQVLLLGIIFLAFNRSFDQAGLDAGLLLGTLAICLLLHALFLAIPWFAARCSCFGLTSADRISALICGSQKTLAFGLPLIAITLGSHPALAVISLPILIYYPLQLLVAAALVPRLRAAATPDQSR
jgi:solute carrier family 10 (sodium/bile acid cotransporter), member 7